MAIADITLLSGFKAETKTLERVSGCLFLLFITVSLACSAGAREDHICFSHLWSWVSHLDADIKGNKGHIIKQAIIIRAQISPAVNEYLKFNNYKQQKFRQIMSYFGGVRAQKQTLQVNRCKQKVNLFG